MEGSRLEKFIWLFHRVTEAMGVVGKKDSYHLLSRHQMPSSVLYGNYLLESWQQFHLADTMIVFSDESSEVQRESTIYPNSHSWYVDFEPKWSDLAPCSLPLAMERSMFKGQAKVGSGWEMLKKYIFKYFKNFTEPRNQMEGIKGSKVEMSSKLKPEEHLDGSVG